MLRKIYFIMALIAGLTAAQENENQPPVVENVIFSQRIDGSYTVDIYYDLNDGDGDTLTITLKVSADAGINWYFPANQITGDVGEGIVSGTGKHIEWNFGVEHPEKFGDRFIIKIIADDGVNEGGFISCPDIPKLYYEGGPNNDGSGNYYNTVLIADKCWMRENLNVGTMILSNSESQGQTNNNIIEKFCYKNIESNCSEYGGLYQWNEAMQYASIGGSQGICPSGWRVPRVIDYESLENLVNDEAAKLIALGQTATAYTPTNETGFSAIFAGFRLNSDANFYSLRYHTNFWSSTELGNNAYEMGLSSNNATVYFKNYNKKDGYSIRCVKN